MTPSLTAAMLRQQEDRREEHRRRERVKRLEARIAELRGVEYPTIAEMSELDRVRNEAAKLNESQAARA